MTTNDLKEAFEALQRKQRFVKDRFAYYDGDQPLKYSANRLNKVFGSRCARFTQNWCAVVVDSILDRMEMTGWDAKNSKWNDALDSLWKELQLSEEAYAAHEAAMVAGEGFIIAEKAEDDSIRVYNNYPGNVVMFYDDSNPNEKRYAAKWFYDDPITRLILYYPDRIEHYYAKGKPTEIVAYTSFQIDEENSGENEYGMIPVFHFRASRRKPKSELDNVMPLQDAVNKLLSDMMITAEFNAFPARYIISNADIDALRNSPSEIWHLPAAPQEDQPTSVGTLAPADLKNYSGQIAELANSIAVITHTPKHYFYNTSAQLSGEALIAMEAPLNKKANRRRNAFSIVWSEVGAFLLQLSGFGDVSNQEIYPIWSPVETIQPKTQAEIRNENLKSGLALSTALRIEGKSADEIDTIMKEKEEEEKQQRTLGESILNNLLAKSAQQNPQESNGGK